MSTPPIREVRLEIVRPGTPHNQLLSPLTPYVALCGEGSPITFYIDMEHQQLLNRLEQLRYVTRQGDRFPIIPRRLRESQVGELGQEIAEILSQIRTLSTELARALQGKVSGIPQSIVHLRLVFSGSELALLPFEMAIAPLAYPGEGLELHLQANLPVSITREIRRSGYVSLPWSRTSNNEPKVLLIYAEPGGMKVPAEEHIQIIRTALEPWIRQIKQSEKTGDVKENARKRLQFVKKRLRVLPNASIQKIYKICSEENFTHVHILAHGDTYEYAGNLRYGIALCRDDQPQSKEVVSGKALVKALQAESVDGHSRCQPLLVTLATCDSGNQTTVLIPGGSIAHDLHAEGIPWVFASQFPLTIAGSIRMADILYPRLFRGDDPRQILFELRRRLYQESQNDHDWASLVAYATLPDDFSEQLAEFSSHQIKEAIQVLLDYADSIAEIHADKNVDKDSLAKVCDIQNKESQLQQIIDQVEEWLKTWQARSPSGDKPEERLQRSKVFGMHGSTYKRLGLLLTLSGEKDGEKAQQYYDKSRNYYQKAMDEAGATGMNYYWTATQFLAMQAIQAIRRKHGERLPKIYGLARSLAERDTTGKIDDSTRAWAYATLAELELLGTYHNISMATPPPSAEELQRVIDQVKDEVKAHCQRIVDLKGVKSFHVGSTLRQFIRYRDFWSEDSPWKGIPDAAIEVLNPDGKYTDCDYPAEY